MKIKVQASARGTLYHYTSLIGIRAILKSGQFNLSEGHMRIAEAGMQKGRLYYLSLTRSRTGRYHSESNIGALISFDGTRLSQRYKLVPVDYWSDPASHTTHLPKEEAEERLLSDHAQLDLMPFVTRVDFITPRPELIRPDVLLRLKLHRIPYSVFPNIRSWISGSPAPEFHPAANKRSGPKFTPKYKDVSTYTKLELLYQTLALPVSKMSPEAKDICGSLKTSPFRATDVLAPYTGNKSSALDTSSATMMRKLTSTLAHYRIKSSSDYVKFVSAKWDEWKATQKAVEDQKDVAFVDRLASALLGLVTKDPVDYDPDTRHLADNPRLVQMYVDAICAKIDMLSGMIPKSVTELERVLRFSLDSDITPGLIEQDAQKHNPGFSL